MIRRIAPLLLLLLPLPGLHAADNRVYLVSQHNFGAKTGFYLDFENTAESGARAKLSSLKLILGVGDGKAWHFLSAQPALEVGRDHTATGTITPEGARLELDGKLLRSEPGAFRPDPSPLLVNESPGWAQAPAEYVITPRSISLTASGGKPLRVAFGPEPPLPVRLFGGRDTRRFETWRADSARTLIVEVTFRIDRTPDDLRALAPFVDRYGRSRHAYWPGKVRDDADLRRATREEAAILKTMPPPADTDPFGGWKKAGWRGRASGFFSVTQRAGRWWLISPEGNPLFYTGVDTAPALTWDRTPVTGREYLFAELPPRDGPTAPAWGENPWGTDPGVAYVSLHTATMLRRYGPDWQRVARETTARRLRAWGFSGLGKFCDPLPGLPSLPVLDRRDVPVLARHPDVFDPAVRNALRESLRRQITPRVNDPTVVGWSVGNEYDEIITPDEVRDILKRSETVPAKRALVAHALETIYGGDIGKAAAAAGVPNATREALEAAPLTLPEDAVETLRRFFADRYYDFLYRTVKQIDPNHLYLGFWISFGWWVNEEDWRLIGRHTDVIGYDRYAYTFADADLNRLARETNKPILCGEFSFPPGYRGARGYGFYPSSAEDEADAARYYARWMQAAATHPFCVGVGWFQYRDEALTGRGPGHGTDLVLGEHFAFGLVDVMDRPKWNLVTPMRRANLAAVRQRLAK